NLQDVLEGEAGADAGSAREGASRSAPGAAASNSGGGDIAARADDGPPMGEGALAERRPSQPAPKPDAPPVRIGRVTLTEGNIDFSDYFIQPNYSANLTGLNGTIGAMRAGEPGEIDL